MKKSRPYIFLKTFATSLIALLFLSPAARAQDTENPEAHTDSSEPLTSLASTTAINTSWEGAHIDINELNRSSTGKYTSLTWTLYNESSGRISLNHFGNKTYLYPSGSSGDGVVLIDESKGLRFNPYIDGDSDCLCAGADASPKKFQLITEPGDHTTYWASYQLSEDTEEVTVEIPGFLPIKDVPVS